MNPGQAGILARPDRQRPMGEGGGVDSFRKNPANLTYFFFKDHSFIVMLSNMLLVNNFGS